MKNKKPIVIAIAVFVGLLTLLYLCGLISQIMTNYAEWQNAGGIIGHATIRATNWNPLVCIAYVFTLNGLKTIFILCLLVGIIYGIKKLYDRFDGKDRDPRGFTRHKDGTYGTAGMMTEKEMKEVLSLQDPKNPEGVILGEYKGKLVCMPKDTELNRHVAVFGASGTMKSRAIIRNALFQALKQNESVVITDPKGEMYADTAELFKNNGYTVKVFNLVEPEHGDSWNCMEGLNGDSFLTQVLTNVIISNTSAGKNDRFWDNGEGNLLKSLIMYVDSDMKANQNEKNLPMVYDLISSSQGSTIQDRFAGLDDSRPSKRAYNIYQKGSDTVKSGIISGLGTRLQIFQNEAVKNITRDSDIDLVLPAKEKCIYYVILSDQDTTLSFLSSLFFSFLFIRLMRFADAQDNRKCPVPVNFILDEFNNVGRIGGAEDGSDFAKTISVCRSRDIRVMLAVQSLGQLQNRYPDNLWAEIVGNCDIQLMLGCTDEISAKYFSNRSGDMTVDVNTTMTMRRTLALTQMIPQYRSQEGIGRRKVMTQDEILRLPHNELLCIIRGYNVLKLTKWDYTNHPMSSEIIKTRIQDYNPVRSPETNYPKEEENIVKEGELLVNKETGEIVRMIDDCNIF